MSKRFEKQSARGGALAERGGGPNTGIVFDWGTTLPADGSSSYAPGALFIVIGGTAGAQLYINEGSNTSSLFLVVGGTRMTSPAGNITFNSSLAGKTLLLNNTVSTNFTLPAATGTGNVYTIVLASNLTSGNTCIRTSGTDAFYGTAFLSTDNANQAPIAFTASNNTVITLNGSTRGGIKGDKITMQDIGQGTWQVTIIASATGTEATPFS